MKILAEGEYFGTMNVEHRFKGIILSEYDYLSKKTDWHLHENPYLMYVLKGDMYDHNKKQKSVCPAGSCLFHNWQEAHFNERSSTEARGFHIEFDRKWFKEMQLDVNLWEGSQMIQNPGLHNLLAKLYFEFKCRDQYSDLTIELLLFQLCENIETTIALDASAEPRWMMSLKEILHNSNEPLSLAYLSKTLGVHPGHLSRAIPRYLNTTLGDYIRRQKINKAVKYMLNSNKSLSEITYSCGFSDQSHFIRLFKIYMEITPKQFRNKIG